MTHDNRGWVAPMSKPPFTVSEAKPLRGHVNRLRYVGWHSYE